jgi:iron complex outermembrane receptor protein
VSGLKRLLLMSGACGVLASSISSVLAQDTTEIAEVVIVTGSYIRGSAEDTALPIDVISAEDLERSGSPSTVDLLKNLSVSSGALGDSNQFAAGAQGTEGTGSVNLRNLGRQRTLVLLNGRRLVNAPQSGSPDTNLIPAGAIGRVEVLKDGAAATYGSDAIGGVVNFITNDRLDGLELGGSYKYIEDTDGDYDTRISWGWQGDSSSFIASASYQHRSELRVADRDFAVRPFNVNPQSFSAGGNPGSFLSLSPGGPTPTTVIRDPDCATLGGVPGFTDTNAPTCYFQFTPFDNLVEKQDQYQAYLEYNVELGETNRLHVEGFYAQTDIPEYRTSPSFLPNQVPTLGAGVGQTTLNLGGARYAIPRNNPGLQDFLARNAATLPPGVAANFSPAGPGLFADLNPLFRPFGVGGNPKTGSTNISDRKSDAFRFSTSLTGELSDKLRWDIGVTYMENNYLTTNNDILVNRFQAALKGFGGFNCTGTTPGANGCLFYNPFASAIQRNAITGQVNPNFNPALANTPELADYLFEKNDFDRGATQIVVDAVFSGESGIELPGGNIGWAAGAQFREETFRGSYNDFANYAINPCVDLGSQTCLSTPGGGVDPSQATGSFFFLGGGFDVDTTQNVYALFTEFSLPILENFSAQVAARFEDYGGSVGDTFDPKLSLRFQATDWLAVRGSIGTSFRGPPANLLNNNSATALQFIPQVARFGAVRVFGNPNLKPEEATTFNIGFLFNAGGLRGSLDYFTYDFKDNFTIEDFSAIISGAFNAQGVLTDCTNPLSQRIILSSGSCTNGTTLANLAGVRVNNVNGSGLRENGIDLDAEYQFNEVLGGALTVGINASYILHFDVNAQDIAGVPGVVPAFDGAGRSNVNTGFTPLPDLKGSAFVNWSRGVHNVRLVTRYVGSYLDSRSLLEPLRNIFTARPSTNGIANRTGTRIGKHITEDLTYVAQLPSEITISASVTNLTDKDPPFARLELGYDPSVVSPIGRAVEIGIRKKF